MGSRPRISGRLFAGAVILALLLGLAISGWPTSAATPGIISYQGRVLNSGTPVTTVGNNTKFKFALVKDNGDYLWNSDAATAFNAAPTSLLDVPVTNGLYSILLGDTTNQSMREIPASAFSNPKVFLRVWFDGGSGLQQFSDQRITASGYAMASSRVDPYPKAKVFHSTTQSLPHNTYVRLNFDSERYDTADIHDNVTNNSRLTCTEAGVYSISARIYFTTSASGYRTLAIDVNGDPVAIDQRPGSDLACITTHAQLAVGDYVEFFVNQDSGSTLSTRISGAAMTELMMAKLP